MDRKGIHQFPLIMLALVLSLYAEAQNLVPNASFEEHSECPDGPGKIAYAYPWHNALGSCNYFHECGTNEYGIPLNIGGGGYARTGQAYGHFILWFINNQQTEVLGVDLIAELEEGKRYRVEFYVSMMDSGWYACKNIGAYFSVEHPPNNIDSIRSYQPQVRYDGSFISDKEGWTRVSGSFVAQGGERFLSIGNFDRYADTETLFVPGGGVNPWHSDVYWKLSAYFIDDVSVMPDSITSVQDVANTEPVYKLYPNPNTGSFAVEVNHSNGGRVMLHLFDASGKLVEEQKLVDGVNTVHTSLAEGLYLYRVTVNSTTQWTGKVSISSH